MNSSSLNHPRKSVFLLMILSCVLVLLALGMSSTAYAETREGVSAVNVELKAAKRSAGIVLRLRWPEKIGVQSRMNSRKLLLEFDSPLESRKLSRQFKSLSRWVKESRYGYDSMLLTWADEFDAKVARNGNQVLVTLQSRASIVPKPEPSVSPEKASSVGYRIRLLQGEAYLESSEPAKARKVLYPLLSEYSNRSELFSALARAEELLGNWPEAVNYYRKAAAIQDKKVFARKESERLLREYGDRWVVEGWSRDVEDADKQTATNISGRHWFGNRWSVDGNVEQRNIESEGVREVGGDFADDDVQRTKGEVTFHYLSPEGARSWGGASAQGVGFGGHAGQSIRHGNGETSIGIEVGKPYWDYVEGIFNGASRDQLRLSHKQKLSDRLRGNISVATNRFHLEEQSDIADSTGVVIGAAYRLRKEKPAVELAYVFDGETVENLETMYTGSGDEYLPLPLSDREAHSVALNVTDKFGDNGFYGTSLGYLEDSKNSSGVFASGRVGVITKEGLEFGLKASRSVSETTTDDANVLELGGYMTWYPGQ